MQENILENLKRDVITCTIFCDLSKAFVTIDHNVLLWKLDNFLKKFFENFLKLKHGVLYVNCRPLLF